MIMESAGKQDGNVPIDLRVSNLRGHYGLKTASEIKSTLRY